MMHSYIPRFDRRSAADWLAEAQRLERMAQQFGRVPDLANAFRDLAASAREKSLLTKY